jgi:hypothetical protein
VRVSALRAGRGNPSKVERAMLLRVSRTQMAIVGAFFGVAFAISGIARGDVAPGLVGGILGAAVVYLVLQRVTEHHADLKRRRERRDATDG